SRASSGCGPSSSGTGTTPPPRRPPRRSRAALRTADPAVRTRKRRRRPPSRRPVRGVAPSARPQFSPRPRSSPCRTISSTPERDPDGVTGGAMNEYSLEHVLSFTGIGEAAPEMIGAVPEGLRVNFYNAGGTVGGPRIRGKVRPVGGDWMTVRPDGVAVVDVRVTFETDDGALI